MRAIGFVLGGMLAACPAVVMAATAPSELLAALQGEVCRGTETRDGAQSPITLEWFRTTEGRPSVAVTLGDGPKVERAVSIRGTGLAFENLPGQVSLMRGDPGDISGSTQYAPGKTATLRLRCARP
jgi:hypothetical protein